MGETIWALGWGGTEKHWTLNIKLHPHKKTILQQRVKISTFGIVQLTFFVVFVVFLK